MANMWIYDKTGNGEIVPRDVGEKMLKDGKAVDSPAKTGEKGSVSKLKKTPGK